MGVEHYLVDAEGKNVLECGKWYELDVRTVCSERDVPNGWRRPLVCAWLREVCAGRPVRLVTDCGVGDVTEFEDETCRPLPGWTALTLFGSPSPGWARWTRRDI